MILMLSMLFVTTIAFPLSRAEGGATIKVATDE
jgi:hypothetical protein